MIPKQCERPFVVILTSFQSEDLFINLFINVVHSFSMFVLIFSL